jgi:hypothetical protein
MLPILMIQASKQMVPLLLKSVQAEHPDCLVYSDMFLWARIIAHEAGFAKQAQAMPHRKLPVKPEAVEKPQMRFRTTFISRPISADESIGTEPLSQN